MNGLPHTAIHGAECSGSSLQAGGHSQAMLLHSHGLPAESPLLTGGPVMAREYDSGSSFATDAADPKLSVHVKVLFFKLAIQIRNLMEPISFPGLVFVP